MKFSSSIFGRGPLVGAFISVVLLLSACSKDPRPKAAEGAGKETPATAGVISPAAAKAAGIDVATAGPTRIRTTLTLYGTVRPNAEREQDIRARYAGIVRTVTKRPGDKVTKGEELLTVESSESLQTYAVRANLSGRVLERQTNPGDTVEPSTVLLKVADLSTVWVEFSVFARDLDRVRAGSAVVLKSADEDAHAETKLSYVSPTGETNSQTVTARAVAQNSDGHWVAGQFVTGEVILNDIQVPVAVRPTALQEFDGKSVVFVQQGDRFEPRAIELGRRSKEAVEVTKGLTAGENYAARNSYLIKADLLKSAAEED